MEQTPPHMNYCVLRGTQHATLGFVRAEHSPTELTLTIHAEGLPADSPLRLMLLSAGEEGAALNLGLMDAANQGRISQTQTWPAIKLQLWDAIVLAEDWPSGRLVAIGWLSASNGPVWRLAEVAAQFLAVPVEAPCLCTL